MYKRFVVKGTKPIKNKTPNTKNNICSFPMRKIGKIVLFTVCIQCDYNKQQATTVFFEDEACGDNEVNGGGISLK